MDDASQPWTTWLDEHGPALVLLARQWAGSHADAEDIVQTAFVRFWRNRHGVRDPAAYLYTCVRRAAVDWLRVKGRSREEALGGRGPEPWFEPAGASSGQDDRGAALQAALAALAPEQRQVLVMKVWGGLTFGTIGQVLGISPNTAASRYRYAVQALRAQLSKSLAP